MTNTNTPKANRTNANTPARLVIAGSASGVGKTTVMAALTLALRRRGLTVAVFKCGPDYLDPTYHARASGVACHNLDGWMMGREAVLATFARAAASADVALIEGVMGLYDGAAVDAEDGSAAEIAKWLAAPVVAVVDASGMARTLAALARGLRDFDPDLALAGVFANRVGSSGHLELLKSACRHAAAPPVLGGLPARTALAFPERHLGLHSAAHHADAAGLDAQLAAWAGLAEEWGAIDPLLRLAGTAPPLPLPENVASGATATRCRIAVARDAAFHFYYEDNLRRLEALGAELAFFSPLADAALPAGSDAVYLGGGYPELHAERLAANRALHAALAAFAAAGGPVYAECGGLMYLAEAIRTRDGRSHAMVGLVPGEAVMQAELQALGYVEVETQRATLFGRAGLRLRGHQFRYSTLTGAAADGLAYRVRRRRGGNTHDEGWGSGNVLASYVHAHWASNPLCAEGFVAAAAAHRQARERPDERPGERP